MKLLKRLTAVIVTAAMMLTASVTTGAINYTEYEGCEDADFDEIVDDATKLTFAKTVTGAFNKKYDNYFYRIECKSDMSVKLEVEVAVNEWNLDMYDVNGDNIKAKSYKATVGSGSYDDYGNLAFRWNREKSISKANASYELKKGTYIIQICSFQTSSYRGGFKLTAYQGLGVIDSRFTVNMKVGDTLALSAGTGVTWKSSNKKVAAVSSTGTVTAKKAGTATITASDGTKSLKIDIKVTA